MEDTVSKEEAARDLELRWMACRDIIKDLLAAGYLRADLELYSKPWPEAIANNPRAWALANTWKATQGNLYFWGVNGVGKSALARRIMFGFLWRNYKHYGAGALTEVSGLSFVSRFCSFEAEKRFDRLIRTPLLFFDDIDKADWTPRSIAYLLEVVDLRNENGRPTLVTSNVDEEKLKAMFMTARPENKTTAVAIIRRLFHVCRTEPMGGQDLRRLPRKVRT